ncbi:hypothetical protein V8687_23660 (plasmid) [Shewanella baltica]|uniref:hypothetical protein n=1 Tax=Shewanella baltica TaxID=62322 RepID=UPI0030D06270
MSLKNITDVMLKAINRHKLPYLTLFTFTYCFVLSAIYDIHGAPFLTLFTVVLGALFILYPMTISPKSTLILMPKHLFYQGSQTRALGLMPLALMSFLNTLPSLTATPAIVFMSICTINYCIASLFFSTLTLEEQFSADHANKTSTRLAIEMLGFKLAPKATQPPSSPLQYYRTLSTHHLLAYHALTSLITLISLFIFIGTFSTPWVGALFGLAAIKACLVLPFLSLGQPPISTANITTEVSQ